MSIDEHIAVIRTWTPITPDHCERVLALLDRARSRDERARLLGALQTWRRQDLATLGRGLAQRMSQARTTADANRALLLLPSLAGYELAHHLSADDLLWLAHHLEDIGPLEDPRAEWYLERALQQWFHHHGPASRDLIALVERLQQWRGSTLLDELLLWIEPTPMRWDDLALSTWDLHMRMDDIGDDHWNRRTAHAVAPLLSDAAARWILVERGNAARRALYVASEEPSLADAILCEWRRRDETGAWERTGYTTREPTRFRVSNP